MAPIHGQFGQFIVWLSVRVGSVGRGQGGAFAGGNCRRLAAHQSQTLPRHGPAHNHTPLPPFLSLPYKWHLLCFAWFHSRFDFTAMNLSSAALCVCGCVCGVLCGYICVCVLCVYLNTRQWIELTTVNPLKGIPLESDSLDNANNFE